MSYSSETGNDIYSPENQRILSRFVEQHVCHCASSMVSELAQQPPFCESEEVLDLLSQYRDHSERIEQIDEKLSRLSNFLSAREAERDAGEAETDRQIERAKAAQIRLGLERDDLEAEQDEPLEALEHWIVDAWLASELAQRGEITGELFDFCIWGRTCSGQSISLDCVIAEIAASQQILVGQRYDWSRGAA